MRRPRAIGDRRAQSLTLANLGNIALALGDFAEAQTQTAAALRVIHELGDRTSEGKILGNLGYIALHLRDYEQARHHASEGVRLAREVGDRSTEARSIGDLGEVAYAVGANDEAATLLTEALVAGREVDDLPFLARATQVFGEVEVARGAPAAAAAHFDAATVLARDVGDARVVTEAALGRVAVALLRDDLPAARAALETSLRDAGDDLTPRAWSICAEVLLGLGRTDDAAALLAAADAADAGRDAVRAPDRARYERIRAELGALPDPPGSPRDVAMTALTALTE